VLFSTSAIDPLKHTRTFLTALALAVLVSPALPALAEETLGDAKQAVKDGARAVGDAARETTKAIGHGARDVTKAIGHETRDATKVVGHESRSAVQSVGDAIKNAWKSLTGSGEAQPKP